MRPWRLKILGLCPEHPKRDQNPKVTPLSETTSISVCFIWESPPGLASQPRPQLPLSFLLGKSPGTRLLVLVVYFSQVGIWSSQRRFVFSKLRRLFALSPMKVYEMNLRAKFSKFLFTSDEQTLRRWTNMHYQEPITRLLVKAKIEESYFDLLQTNLKLKSKEDIKVIYSPNMLENRRTVNHLWNPTPWNHPASTSSIAGFQCHAIQNRSK